VDSNASIRAAASGVLLNLAGLQEVAAQLARHSDLVSLLVRCTAGWATGRGCDCVTTMLLLLPGVRFGQHWPHWSCKGGMCACAVAMQHVPCTNITWWAAGSS
jgi:hypothetical protein